MKFFQYDGVNEKVILNQEGILLVKEFAKLMDEKRNKCAEDKTGKKKVKAYKEFAYMFLFFDWESPFFNELEKDRHTLALDHSGLSDEEFDDPNFKVACQRYSELQESNISMRLLKAARNSVETVIYYFNNIDVNERNEVDGKPIFKTKDLISEIKGCKDLLLSLQDLEKQVKQDLAPTNGFRGDAEIGMFDND